MINIGWGLAFFFSQIRVVINTLLPYVWPMAIVGFLIYLVLKY